MRAGGYPDERVKGRVSLLRRESKIQNAEARAAMRAGTMKPVVDAVNALQAVAWKINEPVLKVMLQCIWQNVPVKGLPRMTPYDKPPHPQPWDKMTDAERRAWRYRADKIEERNRGLVSDRVLLSEDISTAGYLTEAERFYTPFNCDWRGRVYPMPFFNFQRDDRIRALFLFADGAPIGDDGLRYLKIHVANCGDFDKISKRPLEERIAWVEQRMAELLQVAASPMSHLWWTKADKPFLFLAACMELSAAVKSGSAYVTRLPVSFDGSCSGLQHLAAATRDEATAKLVNLTPSETANLDRRFVRGFVTEVGTRTSHTSIMARAPWPVSSPG